MTKLTAAKAKELVKRELGISPASLEQKGHRDYPYYEMSSGNMDVVVLTGKNQLTIKMYISWNSSTITAHFYTDTLEPFWEADTLYQCEADDEKVDGYGDSHATTKARDNMRYQLNRHYHIPQMSRSCKECGCMDTADKQVDWLHRDLCRDCGTVKIEIGGYSYHGSEATP